MPRSPGRVLVTRPEPGASETARRLEELGFVPIKLPLQEIRALPVGADAVPDEDCRGRHHQRQRYPPRAGRTACAGWRPCHVSPSATRPAAIARAAGFARVVEGGAMPKAWRKPSSPSALAGPVVYLCGRVRRPLFEQRLADAGIAVIPDRNIRHGKRLSARRRDIGAPSELRRSTMPSSIRPTRLKRWSRR